MEKRTQFPTGWLPYALVAPQLAITIVFFIWPAAQALWQSIQTQPLRKLTLYGAFLLCRMQRR